MGCFAAVEEGEESCCFLTFRNENEYEKIKKINRIMGFIFTIR